ncbi:hypothetical protein [Quadrisphaera setariae]|uniref:Uncharacterized protein n=1 Tax=Quadrisphaera setariae TaxID=2593304 RepID=A0A5C8Z620_9ACTN|nr:hypothetical protein FMM08_20530 [Quadrisphaera setariae]
MMAAIAALTPPVGVALLFWFVMRAVLRADRSEREAMAALDREDAQRAQAQREAAEREAGERASSSSAPAVVRGEVR